MRVPAALSALPLLTGAVAGVLLVDRVPAGWILCAAAAATLALASAASAIADGSTAEAAFALVIGGAMAGASLGIAAAREAYREPPFSVDGPATIEGTLREDAVVTPSGVSLTVLTRRAAAAGLEPVLLPRQVGVRVAVSGNAAAAHAAAWRAGRTVRVTATLRPPSTYLNFGVPDEARALARRGIALVGSAKSAALVEVVHRGGSIDEAAATARAWARSRLADFVGRWSVRSAAVAAAILIGDRSGISEEDERRLQAAGTYHVIAISGGNIALLAALLMVLFRQVVPARAAPALTILVLLFYARVTGAPPSVARATTAAVVYLAARVIDHRGPALNAVAVAGSLALAAAPPVALDPGFILSFGATLGILLGVPRLVPPARSRIRSGRVRRFARRLATALLTLLAATLCAEAALGPVGAAVFARVTFAGLILNFAAIPLMSVVQVSSMVTLAAADAAPEVAEAAGRVAHVAAAGLVDSARLVEMAPWLTMDVIPPAWWLVSAYYAAAVVLLAVRRLRRHCGAAMAAASLVMLVSPPFAQRTGYLSSRGLLRVVFLDVGQGDATLVELPDGRALLVDAAGLPGSTFDAGERVVAPALRAFGLTRLDALAITHADPDHIGGAVAIVRLFRPPVLWEGVPVPPNEAVRALAAQAQAGRAVWRTVQAGDLDRAAGVDLRVWHPPPPDWERQRVRNNDSIVLEVRYQDVSILLTGDIEREAERLLTPSLSLAPIVVLKAPHHGSATSSTEPFIRAVAPRAVVISSGRRNPFGHPHPVVLARYRNAGAEIFRTDEDGAVMVETDGKGVQLRTYTGRRGSLPR